MESQGKPCTFISCKETYPTCVRVIYTGIDIGVQPSIQPATNTLLQQDESQVPQYLYRCMRGDRTDLQRALEVVRTVFRQKTCAKMIFDFCKDFSCWQWHVSQCCTCLIWFGIFACGVQTNIVRIVRRINRTTPRNCASRCLMQFALEAAETRRFCT